MDSKKTDANANQERNQKEPATTELDEEAFRLVDLLEIEEADCRDHSFAVSVDDEAKQDQEITQLEKQLHEAMFGKPEDDDTGSIWKKDVKSINWFLPREQVLMHIENEINLPENPDINDILQHNAILRVYLQEHPGAMLPEPRCKYSHDATTQIPSMEDIAEIRREIESRLIKMWKAEMSRHFMQDCNSYSRNSHYADVIDKTEVVDTAAVLMLHRAAEETQAAVPLRLPIAEGGTPDRDEALERDALYYHPDFVYPPRRSPINAEDAAVPDDWDNEGYASDELDHHSNMDLAEMYYELLPENLSPEHRANYGQIGHLGDDELQDDQLVPVHDRDDDDRSIFNLIEGVHFVNVGDEEYHFPIYDPAEEPILDPLRDYCNELDEVEVQMQRDLVDVVRPVRINGLGCVMYLPANALNMYELQPFDTIDQNHPLVANMIHMLEFPDDLHQDHDAFEHIEGGARDETEEELELHEERETVPDSEFDGLSECRPSSLADTIPVHHKDTAQVPCKRPREVAQCDGPTFKKFKPSLQLNWQNIRNLKLTKAKYLHDIGMYKTICPPNLYRTNKSTGTCPAETTEDCAITMDDHLGWYNQQMADYGHLLRTGSEDLNYVNIDYMDSLVADNDKGEEVTSSDDDQIDEDVEKEEETEDAE